MAGRFLRGIAGVLTRDGLIGPVDVTIEGGVIVETAPSTSGGGGIVVPAFTNAHSHLEYATLLGKTTLGDMGDFLNSIIALKKLQTPEEIERSCMIAAEQNVRTGVARIWEHSDRPGSAQAMHAHGLSGIVQKEVMDFFREPFSSAEAKPFEELDGLIQFWGPHAPYSIRGETLRWLADTELPLSIHCSESFAEMSLFADGSGGWEQWRLSEGNPPLPAIGVTPVELLREVGFLKRGRQLVHCCAVTDSDIELMARSGISAAHCPRSNKNLNCPIAPVRRMREAGIKVGIGLDSAASSGQIDFFAEMREAISLSRWLGEPLTVDDVWKMACYEGAESMGVNAAHGPWMTIRGCTTLEEALLATPDQVETWMG